MTAIFKRELRSYFVTPLGFVFIGAVFFFSAYFFMIYNLYGATTDMSALFSNIFNVLLFLAPILTMRLLSEEKRSGTDQMLFSSQVSRAGIVIGKYLSALAVYTLAVVSTLMLVFIMGTYAKPDIAVIIGNYIGVFILGMALVAICLFLSAITESQVIAAVCGFGASLILMLTDQLAMMAPKGLVRTVLTFLSFGERYSPFTIGIIDVSCLVFFISVALLFICYTIAVLERKRWS